MRVMTAKKINVEDKAHAITPNYPAGRCLRRLHRGGGQRVHLLGEAAAAPARQGDGLRADDEAHRAHGRAARRRGLRGEGRLQSRGEQRRMDVAGLRRGRARTARCGLPTGRISSSSTTRRRARSAAATRRRPARRRARESAARPRARPHLSRRVGQGAEAGRSRRSRARARADLVEGARQRQPVLAAHRAAAARRRQEDRRRRRAEESRRGQRRRTSARSTRSGRCTASASSTTPRTRPRLLAKDPALAATPSARSATTTARRRSALRRRRRSAIPIRITRLAAFVKLAEFSDHAGDSRRVVASLAPNPAHPERRMAAAKPRACSARSTRPTPTRKARTCCRIPASKRRRGRPARRLEAPRLRQTAEATRRRVDRRDRRRQRPQRRNARCAASRAATPTPASTPTWRSSRTRTTASPAG